MHPDEQVPDDPEAALTPLEVPVPPQLAEAFGYRGPARYVGFYWMPAGDQAVYDDGCSSGTGDSWAFLAYRRHPKVATHLEAYNLGYSDLDAEHLLVLDRHHDLASIAPLRAGQRFLKRQHPPPPPLTPAQVEDLRQAIEAAFAQRSPETQVDPEQIRKAMEDHRQAVARITTYLDQWPEV